LASFEREVRASSDVVLLDGRCYERESVPFKAVDGVVDALSRSLSAMTPSQLSFLVPPGFGATARLFPLPHVDGGPLDQARLRMPHDSNGRYRNGQAEQATYRLVVRGEGWKQHAQRLDLDGRARKRVTVTLERER